MRELLYDLRDTWRGLRRDRLYAVAVAGTLWAWRKPQWFKFCTEVVVEVSQITWPTKPEIRIATIVVIVITLIASGILAAMDTVWSEVTDLLYGI